jgi:asparagine synthase (glutamine-hydrolysing)
MCGIVGFIDKENKLSKKEREVLVKKMLGLIRHRGGEAEGVASVNNMTIGHTRLSIVDVSSQADQPFVDNDSVLSFNGEIYNHGEIRKTYLAKKKINSSSDTATLFELLKTFSIEKVLESIRGMYAFSFLDIKKQLLILALDKLAIKPLYYIDSLEYFAWASEAKAFKVLPNFKYQFEEECLGEYLTFRFIAGEKTLFKNIRKILSGEYLIYSLKNHTFEKKRHYQLTKGKTESKKSLEKTIRESVSSHLMGDNPIGIQLSGGIDSSLVAFFAQNSSPCKLHSFSIGLKDKGWNEFNYSDLATKIIGTKHHKIIFSKNDFVRLFSKLTYYLDEPIIHPNTIPMYLLAKRARKYAKVLLTGEGADELFYGYNRYFSKNLNDDTDLLLSNSFDKPEIISKILKSNGQIISKDRKEISNKAKGLNKVDRISFYDVYTYLPHVLLRQDKAGMAANVENRVPFLYEPVVEKAFNLETKSGKLDGKTPLKKIALKYFPADFVLRKKCGFGLPIAEWLKDEEGLRPLLGLLKDHPLVNKYFIKKEVLNLIKEHLTGIKDRSSLLFSIISLIVWHEVFIKELPT